MPVDYLNENNHRSRLVVNDVPWGLFNGPELELGSESSMNTDPEFGDYQTGGKKTGAEVELDRPWRRSRDLTFFLAGDAGRGSLPVLAALIEYDDFGTALRTIVQKNGTLQKVASPAGNAASSDPTSFKVTVDLNP